MCGPNGCECKYDHDEVPTLHIDPRFISAVGNGIIHISQSENDERAAKFAYDIMCGLLEGNEVDRFNAWADWLNREDKNESVDEERNGVWVPAIPVKYFETVEDIRDQ